ncbi:RHS repeat-associated core domain-containing protein [Luteibacter yeojuensis]
MPCALVLSMVGSGAMATDVDPYVEHEVKQESSPAQYFTDINEAAALTMSIHCGANSFSGCQMEKVSPFNAIYIVDIRYTTSTGFGSTSIWNYRYYACDSAASLYIVSGDTVWGPYPNRHLGVREYWGDVVCRYNFDPETGTVHQSDLGPGDCETRPNVGNPINVGLNNKYQEVIDIAATSGSPLTWSRYYNSGIVGDSEGAGEGKPTVPSTAHLGSRWRGTYDRSLALITGATGALVRLQRHTGERLDFSEVDGRYQSVADPRGQLLRESTGWTYRTAGGEIESYDADGRLVAIDAGTDRHVRLGYGPSLLEVIDLQGRKLTFAYDSAGRIATVSDGAGVAVTYKYREADGKGLDADLAAATYADGSLHDYYYNEAVFQDGANLPHALTSIYDETKQRFAIFRYDRDGRAVRSEHADGIDGVQLTREADGSVAVTGPTKTVHRYHFAEVRGVRRLVGIDQPGGAGCGAANSKIEYDGSGLVSSRTDFDGRTTTYRYDTEGNEIERTEAAGTPAARRTATVWDAVLRKPTRITWLGREERFTYDTSGNITAREAWGAIDPGQPGAPLTLSRVWRMAYDAEGRLIHEEGPRSDTGKMGTLARHTYRGADAPNCAQGACDYRKGDLWKSEDALGHAEEILAYDPSGRVRSRRDVHGTTFTYAYSSRGWLTEVKEMRPDGAIVSTTLTYTPRGDVASVTDGDGIALRFEYDAAGRLIQVANPSNHRLRFTLDAAGNRITEEGYDTMFLKTQIKRTFDALGRVETETHANNAVTRYTYDERGRPTGVTDADGRHDTSSYDALGRLRESIQDIGGVGASTKASYDPLDQLTSIEDPKGLTTHYLATGLGDVGSIDSPDSGESTDEYDVAGLLVRHEGAGGIGSFDVTRDALGRPTLVRHEDVALDTRYLYDMADTACPAGERHATGRLSVMTQASSRTVYCHDAAGNVTRKVQSWGTTVKTVSYRYSPAGRLQEVAIEGGSRTTYQYDKDGSVSGVAVAPDNGAMIDLIAAVAYRPFDLIESWRYGNGWRLSATRDDSGRITAWSGIDPDNSFYWFALSPAGQIESQTARAYAFRFDHDGLGNLSAVANTDGETLRSFDYNSAGDRTSMTVGGIKQAYLYDPASHHLSSTDGKLRRYDAAGNTIAIGDATLAYDAVGRLASASEQGRLLVTYGYNAADERIVRTEAGGAKSGFILYDEMGHWLADYDSTGKVTRQAVWMGDYLVGLVDGGKLLYVEPDHLGSPRSVIDPERKITLWRWRPSDDPFGTALPDEDPDADGTRFVFDLRFPGQRYDALTGLHYNYYRDYDPGAGRYIQVDPIGLAGGVNPYLYADASPMRHIDPLGLTKWEGKVQARGIAAGVGVALYKFLLESDCINGQKAQVTVHAGGASIGLNIKFAPPISATSSSVTLEDRLDHVDPNVLNGWFSVWGAGASFGPGYGASSIQLGGNGRILARPKDSGAWSRPSFGSQNGLELGAGGTAGRSNVVETNWTSCGCARQ